MKSMTTVDKNMYLRWLQDDLVTDDKISGNLVAINLNVRRILEAQVGGNPNKITYDAVRVFKDPDKQDTTQQEWWDSLSDEEKQYEIEEAGRASRLRWGLALKQQGVGGITEKKNTGPSAEYIRHWKLFNGIT